MLSIDIIYGEFPACAIDYIYYLINSQEKKIWILVLLTFIGKKTEAQRVTCQGHKTVSGKAAIQTLLSGSRRHHTLWPRGICHIPPSGPEAMLDLDSNLLTPVTIFFS